MLKDLGRHGVRSTATPLTTTQRRFEQWLTKRYHPRVHLPKLKFGLTWFRQTGSPLRTISTGDQHSETQLYDLRELAKQRRYEIVHEYTDTISGAKSKLQADGTACSGKPAYCTTAGTNPRLFLQVPGGPTSNPQSAKRFFPFPKNSLLVDHWYDMVLHMVWSPTVGYVQWWVDGQKMVDVATPTEYVRSDGTWSYGASLGLYNYRPWAPWASSVDGEQFIWGPTASSINFNPGNPPSVTPSAPTSLSGTDNVSASTTINWAASVANGVSGYNVYRTTTSGSGYANVGTTSALSFTDHTVKVGTTYYYVVTAVANGVESPHSSEIQVFVAQ
jgi:hypothetical protein